MRRRNALPIAIAAVLGALAIFALPALAGTNEDHHRGDHRSGERHHHGRGDGHRNAGKISAFDAGSGQLTIARFRGGTISGLVTGATEIKCEGRDDSARFSRDSGSSGSGSGDDNGGSNSGPGSGSGDDNSGRGEEEPGDDHGGRGEPKPGDDHGGHGEEPGDDHGVRGDNSGPGSGGRNDDDRLCTTAELTVGTVVQEADRDFVNGVASFDEIELAHSR